jgi:hypothetical protein
VHGTAAFPVPAGDLPEAALAACDEGSPLDARDLLRWQEVPRAARWRGEFLEIPYDGRNSYEINFRRVQFDQWLQRPESILRDRIPTPSKSFVARAARLGERAGVLEALTGLAPAGPAAVARPEVRTRDDLGRLFRWVEVR